MRLVNRKIAPNRLYPMAVVAVCRNAAVSRFITEDRDFARFRRFPMEGL